MKKILFICSNMNIGGFQKSLVNLLINFDYNRYEVDLFLIDKDGIFMDSIPSEVNIVKSDKLTSSFFCSTFSSIKQLFKENKYLLIIPRLIIGLISVIDKGYGAILMSKFIPKINKEYDCCIDYNGQYLNYYMIDKVNAKRKITYFHSDYAKWDYYKRADKIYYKQADAIVTISDMCVKSLISYFPEYKDKIYCIENIVTEKTVDIFDDVVNFRNTNEICLLTVGRVCFDKGLQYAVEAAKMLKDDNISFKWYWVGPGNEIEEHKQVVKKNQVEDVFIFLGPTVNPYTYIKQCDIAVYPSKFEGKSVVIEETKIIHKPIVVTNFSTVKNQIQNGKSGLIVELSSKAVYEGVRKLIIDNHLKEIIVNYQTKFCNGNKHEIEKVYKLIDRGDFY